MFGICHLHTLKIVVFDGSVFNIFNHNTVDTGIAEEVHAFELDVHRTTHKCECCDGVGSNDDNVLFAAGEDIAFAYGIIIFVGEVYLACAERYGRVADNLIAVKSGCHKIVGRRAVRNHHLLGSRRGHRLSVERELYGACETGSEEIVNAESFIVLGRIDIAAGLRLCIGVKECHDIVHGVHLDGADEVKRAGKHIGLDKLGAAETENLFEARTLGRGLGFAHPVEISLVLIVAQHDIIVDNLIGFRRYIEHKEGGLDGAALKLKVENLLGGDGERGVFRRESAFESGVHAEETVDGHFVACAGFESREPVGSPAVMAFYETIAFAEVKVIDKIRRRGLSGAGGNAGRTRFG